VLSQEPQDAEPSSAVAFGARHIELPGQAAATSDRSHAPLRGIVTPNTIRQPRSYHARARMIPPSDLQLVEDGPIAVAGVALAGATRQLPLVISPCATCGGITQAQKASRSMFLAAVLPLPQADKETILT